MKTLKNKVNKPFQKKSKKTDKTTKVKLKVKLKVKIKVKLKVKLKIIKIKNQKWMPGEMLRVMLGKI